jgi:hypothetical protein
MPQKRLVSKSVKISQFTPIGIIKKIWLFIMIFKTIIVLNYFIFEFRFDRRSGHYQSKNDLIEKGLYWTAISFFCR